ncbi:ribonuclease R [Spiroplasma endosymbiont of Crioceris asparagi]|uniref:ribonuclease R n=1 Tax=Spiroplasma endosymbiont of Crioceris asparagi TaxID=3066286 RepID=UPI0030CFC5FB
MKEQIINILEKEKITSIDNLKNLLNIEKNKFFKLIDELIEEKKIYKTIESNIILNNKSLKKGTIRINSKCFGFIKPLEEYNEFNQDFFVPKFGLNNSISNDEVIFSYIEEDDGRYRGNVEGIIKRDKKTLVGIMSYSQDKRFLDFIPSDPAFINYRIVLVNKNKYKLKEDLIVKVSISNVKQNKMFVYIDEIIGDANKAVDRIISIAYENEIEPGFSSESLKEAEEVAKPINKNDIKFKKRLEKNLFNKPIVTIDGADSKDLDDAVCVEKVNDNYVLTVAIADVSYYVRPRTKLDYVALYKGNSTYLANKVLPMLPEVLSNGVCSLNPNEEKLCMVCEMTINKNGEIIDSNIYESIMISKARLTYGGVNDLFETKKSKYPDEVNAMLWDALELHNIIEKRKDKLGTIDFDIPEPKAILNANSDVVDIVARERGIAERLIENFMVSANVTVALEMEKIKMPFLYRNHESPKKENMGEWVNSLKLLGINVPFNLEKDITPLDVKQALEKIANEVTDVNEKTVINITLLRYMEKARYESENIGHFGLAANTYTHFTSPIRRYSDLMVHRYLKKYLINKEDDYQNENISFIDKACEIINETEKKSLNAEREVNKVCMAEFMKDKVGQEYNGIISAILKFGIFVQLENCVEGLVHITNLKNATFDEKRNIYTTDDKKTYKLGQKVKIKVIAADVKRRIIDFEFC